MKNNLAFVNSGPREGLARGGALGMGNPSGRPLRLGMPGISTKDTV
jgi:hypothetical protein